MASAESTSAKRSERSHWSRILVMTVALTAAWLLWSGFFKPLILMLGAFSVFIVLVIAYRMHLFDTDVFALRFTSRLFRFWAWLFKEIVKSSLDVTRLVLDPKMPIKPTVIDFEATSVRPVEKAILGNSITLTPGTLTLSIDDQKFTVHSLTEDGARAILDGEMDRRVSGLQER